MKLTQKIAEARIAYEKKVEEFNNKHRQLKKMKETIRALRNKYDSLMDEQKREYRNKAIDALEPKGGDYAD